MSSDIAIKVENLSKSYQIYEKPHDRLKQSIFPRLHQLFGKRSKQYFREFAALKDVSFEVKRGETVGIIGRNGSGKSTLLQMICGTLNPTQGSVLVNGRVAALLELGAGFNPEFTGRENIFTNGALLGLKKHEIEERFEEILAFADIGEFIEQPVKTYSSGMFVRLAFAIAVHTNPEILIVDEALSVGDIAFQNKCSRKIQSLKLQGASVLFVSHDLSTMQIMCDRVIWINGGRMILNGDPIKVSQEYYASSLGVDKSAMNIINTQIPQQSTGMARFTSLRVLDSNNMECQSFMVGDEIRIAFELEALEDLNECVFTVSVYRADGDWLLGQTSREEDVIWSPAQAGEKLKGLLRLKENCLAPNDFLLAFAAYNQNLTCCYALTDLGNPFSVRGIYQIWGKFVHPCTWSQPPFF